MKSNDVTSYSENDVSSSDDALSHSVTSSSEPSLTSCSESVTSPNHNNLRDSCTDSHVADEYCNAFNDSNDIVKHRATAAMETDSKENQSGLNNKNNDTVALPATTKRTRKSRTRGIDNPQALIKVTIRQYSYLISCFL